MKKTHEKILSNDRRGYTVQMPFWNMYSKQLSYINVRNKASMVSYGPAALYFYWKLSYQD